MLDKWVFIDGAAEMLVACLIYFIVLRQQYFLFKYKSSLQPLKKLLFAAVLLLIIGCVPLTFVYLNIVWFHLAAVWIVYIAVISNATAHVVTGVILYLIYRFRSSDDDVLK